MVRGYSNSARIDDGAFSSLGKRKRVANVFAILSLIDDGHSVGNEGC